VVRRTRSSCSTSISCSTTQRPASLTRRCGGRAEDRQAPDAGGGGAPPVKDEAPGVASGACSCSVKGSSCLPSRRQACPCACAAPAAPRQQPAPSEHAALLLPAGDGGEGVGTSQPAEPRPFLSREDLITYTIAIAASYLFRACAPPLYHSRPASRPLARGCGSLPCSLLQLCGSLRCAVTRITHQARA